jgi:hypothetical protein
MYRIHSDLDAVTMLKLRCNARIILHREINPSFVGEEALFPNMSRRVMDLEETEARNDC